MKQLDLTRKDLTKEARENLSIDEIEYIHIKGGIDMFRRADKVVFIDDDGKSKILKQKYKK